MHRPDESPLNGFCWLDLAARDMAPATTFYAQAFGWRFETQRANDGSFTRCRAGTREVGSLYPLRRAQLERGVSSHWTPYIRVGDVDALAARIALIEDAVGAALGLWQSLPAGRLGTIGP